jgi:hypothetical protein
MLSWPVLVAWILFLDKGVGLILLSDARGVLMEVADWEGGMFSGVVEIVWVQQASCVEKKIEVPFLVMGKWLFGR